MAWLLMVETSGDLREGSAADLTATPKLTLGLAVRCGCGDRQQTLGCPARVAAVRQPLGRTLGPWANALKAVRHSLS